MERGGGAPAPHFVAHGAGAGLAGEGVGNRGIGDAAGQEAGWGRACVPGDAQGCLRRGWGTFAGLPDSFLAGGI